MWDMGLWVGTGGFKARKQVQYLLEQIGFSPQVGFTAIKNPNLPFSRFVIPTWLPALLRNSSSSLKLSPNKGCEYCPARCPARAFCGDAYGGKKQREIKHISNFSLCSKPIPKARGSRRFGRLEQPLCSRFPLGGQLSLQPDTSCSPKSSSFPPPSWHERFCPVNRCCEEAANLWAARLCALGSRQDRRAAAPGLFCPLRRTKAGGDLKRPLGASPVPWQDVLGVTSGPEHCAQAAPGLAQLLLSTPRVSVTLLRSPVQPCGTTASSVGLCGPGTAQHRALE